MEKPNWQIYTKDNFQKLFELSIEDNPIANKELFLLMQKASDEYHHWDKFRYQKMPKNISVKDAWCYLIMKRNSKQEILPIKANNGIFFTLGLTRKHYKDLSVIDSLTSGILSSPTQFPEGKGRYEVIIGAFIEEAINSSQLEGASTLRETAKEMIRKNKTPRDDSEQMILNNYNALTKIEQWLDRELSEDFIKEIHKIIADKILSENECGEYRKDTHNIVIGHSVTDKVFHRPKEVAEMEKDMKALFQFTNENNKNSYMHPVIKAIILHFWIGYLHPFTDGNGRLARLLFYWYLMKQDYWPFKYVPISNIIKRSKTAYGNAYLNSEQKDELDVGYFVQYILRTMLLSIDQFKTYLSKKRQREDKIRTILNRMGDFNDRQIHIVYSLTKRNDSAIDIGSHKKNFQISYEIARKDFILLMDKKILIQRKSGKKYIYTLNNTIFYR